MPDVTDRATMRDVMDRAAMRRALRMHRVGMLLALMLRAEKARGAIADRLRGLPAKAFRKPRSPSGSRRRTTMMIVR